MVAATSTGTDVKPINHGGSFMKFDRAAINVCLPKPIRSGMAQTERIRPPCETRHERSHPARHRHPAWRARHPIQTVRRIDGGRMAQTARWRTPFLGPEIAERHHRYQNAAHWLRTNALPMCQFLFIPAGLKPIPRAVSSTSMVAGRPSPLAALALQWPGRRRQPPGTSAVGPTATSPCISGALPPVGSGAANAAHDDLRPPHMGPI